MPSEKPFKRWVFKLIEVTIQGRVLKTPQDHIFQVPTQALAKAIEAEWQKDSSPHYQHKPLTSLAATALDRIAGARNSTIDELLNRVSSDAILFWAKAPPFLVKAQEETWAPLISKVNKELHLNLKPTTSLSIEPLEDEGKIKAFLEQLNDFRLMGFLHLITLTESFCLSFLVLQEKLTPEEAWEAAQLPEKSQQEVWGEDLESKNREEHHKEEFLETALFLKLCGEILS